MDNLLVARFSNDIKADIERGWSTWMLPGLGGTYSDCEQDAEDFGFSNAEIREFPEHPGSFGIIHHEGLSCYLLDAESVEEAIEEVKERHLDGSGYGHATIGKVLLLRSIPAKEAGSIRDLHILEVEDCKLEEW